MSKILVEGEGWKVVAKDVPKITFLRGRPDSTIGVFTEDLDAHIDVNGKFEKDAPGDAAKQQRVPSVWHGPTKYWIDPENKAIEKSDPRLKETWKLDTVTPSCLVMWPGEECLVVGCSDSSWLLAVHLDQIGGQRGSDRYYSLRTKPGEKTTKVKDMVMDAGNLLYAATPLGVQVFDPTGRLCGVIPPAIRRRKITAITIGGKDARHGVRRVRRQDLFTEDSGQGGVHAEEGQVREAIAMKRILIAAVLLLCTTATGSAQDIPLSKILVENESWKVAAKDLPAESGAEDYIP